MEKLISPYQDNNNAYANVVIDFDDEKQAKTVLKSIEIDNLDSENASSRSVRL